jgi:hypothetical protein
MNVVQALKKNGLSQYREETSLWRANPIAN